MPRAASNAQVDSGGGEISPEILEACRQGDREALRALYDAYRDRVYSIAYYFLHANAAAAADVTQQVFLKLIDGIAQYRGGAAFSTWLYRIVVNACIDSTRRGRASAHVTDTGALLALRDPRSSEEDRYARQEIARSVQDAVATLPPKLRVAILLRYFDELDYAAMSEVLNCSIGTVSSRLSRAHRLLARRLAHLQS
jgi:RNA polymerase sigma-70 factor (ECF subfamily)